MKSTPILVADGVFDREGVAARFRESSRGIEADIADLVLRQARRVRVEGRHDRP